MFLKTVVLVNAILVWNMGVYKGRVLGFPPPPAPQHTTKYEKTKIFYSKVK